MIKKEGSVPYKLLGLRVLERRLLTSSREIDVIREHLRTAQAGVNGEKRLKGVFGKYTFPFEHYIFHGLNLRSTGKFQIDTLFLSHAGAVVLEMKNIGGRIRFSEELGQLIRTLDNGKEDTFECPSVQLERNRMLLGDWFHMRQIAMPIHGAVVFAKPQQQFENTREHLRILFPLEVPVYLRNLGGSSENVDSTILKEVVAELEAADREYNPFPMCSTYHIDPKDIATGVMCDACGLFGMTRISRGWVCETCSHFDRHAHRKAIADWFMLFGGKLTNRACREFLHINDINVAKRLLNGMNISCQGTNKGRAYWMDIQDIVKHSMK
ncbi:nuclease-related domain-containing protein [Sporosarcina sp. FSL K6-3457]|uniref:nuclease-related domain-containing protein n=1 Tax=Sporosarcina sp. FSL K6-3457 TaxID=2978204 RepID=UPI0030F855E6